MALQDDEAEVPQLMACFAKTTAPVESAIKIGEGMEGRVYKVGRQCKDAQTCADYKAVKVQPIPKVADSQKIRRGANNQQIIAHAQPDLATRVVRYKECGSRSYMETDLFDGDMQDLGERQFAFLEAKYPGLIQRKENLTHIFYFNDQLNPMLRMLFDLGEKLSMILADAKPANVLFKERPGASKTVNRIYNIESMRLSDFNLSGTLDDAKRTEPYRDVASGEEYFIPEPLEGFTDNDYYKCSSIRSVPRNSKAAAAEFNVWQMGLNLMKSVVCYTADRMSEPKLFSNLTRFEYVAPWMLSPARRLLYEKGCKFGDSKRLWRDDISKITREVQNPVGRIGANMQLAFHVLTPGKELGRQTAQGDLFLRFELGAGVFEYPSKKDASKWLSLSVDEKDALFVPMGQPFNLKASDYFTLRWYSLSSPPQFEMAPVATVGTLQ